ncbi:M6 family metalloprotease domain-containing protein, partial [Bacteroidales bacterium OttesenSCG-928-L03]|nr:M6 family metalloprotease domain-containing protein [Bacteroidales bacterium OttesenSCG-928-L03]
MKRIFFILFMIANLVGLAGHLLAAPAVPWLVEKVQPDGSTVSVYVRGDEQVNWMESPDGYTLLNNEQNYVVYAGLDQAGDLIPSEIIYDSSSLRSASERTDLPFPKGLRYSRSQREDMLRKWEKPQLRNSTPGSTSVLGDKKALCILVNFRNKAFVKTRDEVDSLMNQVGYNKGTAVGSVKDFYRENSYGKMDLTVSLAGPYTLSGNTAYYAPQEQWQEFAREALLLADADVDFREFANESGQLETVHILFAGYGDESVKTGSQIWSHKWGLDQPLSLDGVQCAVYSCSPELRGSNGQILTSIGVICHELCHVFGASDYYDTGEDGTDYEYLGTGDWDLMAKGCWNRSGDIPAHINSFEKIRFGWVDPIELTEPATISQLPNSTQYPFAYIIKPYTNNEQYILENRQQIGYNSQVPSRGLLIYHIHDSSVSTGNVSNAVHPQQAYLISASSSYPLPDQSPSSYGFTNLVGTPFSRKGNIASFTKETTPAMFRWEADTATLDGVLDKPLTQIKQTDGLISFDFMQEGDTRACYPVRNPEFFVVGSDSLLVWEMPLNDTIDYTYEVYRDKELIGENLNDTLIRLTGTTPGMTLYRIKAKTADSDSCSLFFYSDNSLFYHTIDSLSVTQFKQNVLLSWNLPEKEHPYDSLHIYRNEDRIISLPDTIDSYCDSGVAPGDYRYTIITDYGNDKYAFPVSDSISVGLYTPCGEIDGLLARVELDTVFLSWEEVEDVPAYHVYRDTLLIGEGITTLYYQDTITAPIDSVYTYYVEVADTLCLLPGSSVEVIYTYPYLPAKDLLIEQFKQHILLSWTLPDTEAVVD